MPIITHTESYYQYKLYEGVKSDKGFYLSILSKLYHMFNEVLSEFTIPVVGHVIIDNPKSYKISQALSRIITKESNTRGIEVPKFHYIAVTERKRKDAHNHQHLVIFLDKGDYHFFQVIMLQLRKYSRTSIVKLSKRMYDKRPDFIDPTTGEIRKKGSAYLHNVRNELLDAFERISYIAKVHTKVSPSFSSSRLLVPDTLRQD